MRLNFYRFSEHILSAVVIYFGVIFITGCVPPYLTVKEAIEKGNMSSLKRHHEERLGGGDLAYSAINGNMKVSKYILSTGVDPTSESYLFCPLAHSLFNNNYDIARLLIKYGAKIPVEPIICAGDGIIMKIRRKGQQNWIEQRPSLISHFHYFDDYFHFFQVEPGIYDLRIGYYQNWLISSEYYNRITALGTESGVVQKRRIISTESDISYTLTVEKGHIYKVEYGSNRVYPNLSLVHNSSSLLFFKPSINDFNCISMLEDKQKFKNISDSSNALYQIKRLGNLFDTVFIDNKENMSDSIIKFEWRSSSGELLEDGYISHNYRTKIFPNLGISTESSENEFLSSKLGKLLEDEYISDIFQTKSIPNLETPPESSNNELLSNCRRFIINPVYNRSLSSESLGSGSIYINNTYKNTPIFVNNSYSGNESLLIKDLPIGLNSIKVKKEGCAEFNRLIIVKPNIIDTLNVLFQNPIENYGKKQFIWGGVFAGLAIINFIYPSISGEKINKFEIAFALSLVVTSAIFNTSGIVNRKKYNEWDRENPWPLNDNSNLWP